MSVQGPFVFFFILYSCDFISFEMCLNLKKINILFVKSLVLNDMRKKCSVNMISFLRDRQIAPKKPIICAVNVESTRPETTRTGWFSGLHYGWFWTWHNQKCCTKCNKKTKQKHFSQLYTPGSRKPSLLSKGLLSTTRVNSNTPTSS